MDLKNSYSHTSLRPIYAGSGAVASISEDGTILATPLLDEINIIKLSADATVEGLDHTKHNASQILHKIENDDEQEITALALTPDAQYLCYVSQAQLLKIFKLSTGKIVKSMKISSPSYVLETDPTSTLLAIGGTDGSVTVIDIENGYITHSLKGHGATISSLKFYGEQHTNTWLLSSGDTNGMVKIWDLVSRKAIHTLQEHNSAVRGIDFKLIEKKNSEDSLQLITGARDDVINHWEFKDVTNLKRCKLLKTIPVHQQIEACGFIINIDGIDDDLIYTSGGDAVLQIVSLNNNSIVKKSKKPLEELFIIGVLPVRNFTQLYLVFSDQTLQLVDLKDTFSNPKEYIEVVSSLAGNHGTIADMKVVGPNFDKLALATNSSTLRIIPISDVDDSNSVSISTELYEGHTDLLNAVDATEDGLWIATASKDNSAILWRYNPRTTLFCKYAHFQGHVSSVTSVGLPNVMNKGWPEYLITASNDLTVKKWKVPKPTDRFDIEIYSISSSEYTRRAHEKDINMLSISPNDSIFATASYDKTCKIWDLETGELKATLNNHKRGLWDVSFCQYDKFIATASGDKTVKIWSLDTFTVVKTLEGHSNAVQRCSFFNKQKQLVSTGADGLVKLWDCSTGECINTLDGHDNRIWALNVIKDGDIVITADADGVFQFWKDRTEEAREEDIEKEKLKVEQMQTLENYISSGDWTNAFLLAITLDHPARLYNVLKQSTRGVATNLYDEDGNKIIFNKELDNVISTLNDEQLLMLMQRCRDWNTNGRTHSVAQKTINCILTKYNISKLSDISGMMKVIDSILPYSQRHFNRVDNLIEESYILDHALVEMDKLF
ncbi:hypothetical protein TPHA_0L01080 [Tetrapisispora phaffii CBS 4417]|uniref:Uncharacterized protein n=1 Tax=Tetrapisispora phaffii (strain ATCC 24235 / CBS 4417 / NBRC 1672 / NRRL Y-8282 / UCD 70-5) TaxID=1071381 RepID=G8BZY7_TETPH|nr:hypothetical protein TPHA_0L01080 [Tetrapisispora phaffii CBS 4417]CCE65465.1 hypothetical protein TPHA_0L01080 [Tetrapisispora phaffii CBS 4417]